MFKWDIQSVDGHAGSLLDPDSAVGGSRGTLLVRWGDTDADHQPARQNAIIPRVHRDNERSRCTHGLTLESDTESEFKKKRRKERSRETPQLNYSPAE